MGKHALRPKLCAWLRALTNPHLLISFGIAWFLTNGWAYCAAGIGWYLGNDRLMRAGTVWLGILWAPGTPEKLFTLALAIGILKLLFPQDTRTLAMITRKRRELTVRTKMAADRIRSRLCRKRRAP